MITKNYLILNTKEGHKNVNGGITKIVYFEFDTFETGDYLFIPNHLKRRFEKTTLPMLVEVNIRYLNEGKPDFKVEYSLKKVIA
jgi:hypothetical protein